MAGGSIMPNLSGGADGGPGWTIGPLGGMTGHYYNGGVAVDGAVSAKKIFTQLNRLVVQAADGTRIAPMITRARDREPPPARPAIAGLCHTDRISPRPWANSVSAPEQSHQVTRQRTISSNGRATESSSRR